MCVLFGWLNPGPMDMLIVGVIILLLFGNRLPSVMRSLGQGVVEFKKGIEGVEEDIRDAGSKKVKKDETEKEQPSGEKA
jgi:sec-independent protein translocase protein TatA